MDMLNLQAIAAYVPLHVVHGALEGRLPVPGETESIEAAVLFADIAGFTSISERMVRALSHQSPHEGHRGSEELNRLLTETFTALMQPIIERGGIVARFSGDALTAYFERPANTPPEYVLTCALVCASAMQCAMTPFLGAQVADQRFPLSVKIGVGYGPALRLTVGNAELGLEAVLVGPAVDAAALAEKHARQGQVVISQSTLDQMGLAPQVAERHDGFAAVTCDPELPCRLERLTPNLDCLDESRCNALLAALKPYLPREVFDNLLMTGGELPGDFRRVTSIFVGFEGLTYDSPAAGLALQDYFCWAQTIVASFEGRLNRVITGDKGSVLHILFGAPDKHDDDLVRALRCALKLQNDSARPAAITAQRIGIASGIVLARPIGSKQRREYTVLGDEVNLSSRLMTSGGPGAILVDSYTRDRTAQSFVFETLPPLQLKGKEFPVKAYRLLAERKTVTGLTARYLSSRWTLVGRAAERAAVLAAADEALEGHGRSIFIGGRAGVGKTRLVEEVVRHWVNRGGNGYMGQCLSHGLNSPYLPWIDMWRVFFDFREPDDPAACWRKVETVIAAQAGALSAWAGVVGALLSLPVPESPALAALDAAERRRKLFELTLELLRTRADQQPLLLLFEDLHWADRPSLDLIDYIAARIDDTPLLLCLCARPRDDLDLQTLALPTCTQIALEELAPEASAAMIRAVLRQANLPPDFERQVFDKTQGNPLFVEELLTSLIESGLLAHDGQSYQVVGDLSQVRVPDTLQDLLMARIDRLEPPSRDLLQVASVIDRRFAYDVLRGIYPYRMVDVEMRERLEATIQVDLTRLDHPEPELAYLFKHALTYEVAYNSLPFARRRELHERVGDFLELAHLKHLEQYYPVLARHFSQSERWDKTLVYALAAGSQAQELYANDEALQYYAQAEQCLDKLPLDSYWINAVRLYLNRAKIYRLKGQYDLCETDLHKALALAQTHQDGRAQAETYNLLAELRWWQARNEQALQAAHEAFRLATDCGNESETLSALRLLGNAHYALGQTHQAMDYFLQAHALAAQRQDQVALGWILNSIGVAYLSLEQFDQALDAFQQALRLLEAVELKHRVASCLTNIGITQFHLGHPQAALESYKRAIATGQASGWLVGVAYTCVEQAEVQSYLGEYVAAFETCQRARAVFRETNDTLGEAYVQLVQAGEICVALELYSQARAALETALTTMRANENLEPCGRILLRLTECALHQRDWEAADAYLAQVAELTLTRWQTPLHMWLASWLAWERGAIEQADLLAQETDKHIQAGGDPNVLGPMWLVRARIAAARSDLAAATMFLDRAVEAVGARASFAHRLFVLEQAAACAPAAPHLLAEAHRLREHVQAQRAQYLETAQG